MNVNERNILAIKQHSEDTRKLLREMETKLSELNNFREKITMLEQQIQTLFKRL